MSRYRRVFDDPAGQHHGLPTYPWRMVPDGPATRRQLRAMVDQAAPLGRQPGRRPPVAQLMWYGIDPATGTHGPRNAWLYRVDLSRPKRPPSAAQLAAVKAALAARSTCRQCGRRYEFCLPRRWGRVCVRCVESEAPGARP